MERDQANKKALRQSLLQLRDEMSRLDFQDNKSKHKLEQMISRVELHLDSDKSREQLDDILQSVSNTVSLLEVEHPTLTASLSQVITALSSMGI